MGLLFVAKKKIYDLILIFRVNAATIWNCIHR